MVFSLRLNGGITSLTLEIGRFSFSIINREEGKKRRFKSGYFRLKEKNNEEEKFDFGSVMLKRSSL